MEISIKCTAKEFRHLITGELTMSLTKDGIFVETIDEAEKRTTPVKVDIKDEPREFPTARTVLLNHPEKNEKPQTKKQRDDINAIKEAYKKAKEDKEGKEGKEKQGSGRKKDINAAYVIAEHDYNKRSFESIAKEYGVYTQTIINHYNAEMERRKK